MKKVFFILLLFVTAVGGGLAYYVKDKERLKTQLSEQLSEASGYEVKIDGDIAWRVLPHLGLAVGNVKLRDAQTQIHISKLSIRLALSELTKSPQNWQLEDLILSEIRIKDAGFRLQRFAMQRFTLGQPTPFQTQILMLQGAEPSEVRASSAPINVEGLINYRLLDSQKVPGTTLSDLKIIQSTIKARLGNREVNAQCTGSIKENGGAAISQSDSLNLYNSEMECKASQFSLEGMTWSASQFSVTTVNGRLRTALLAEDGSVDISKLKQTISTLSGLIGRKDPTQAWPSVIQYRSLDVAASLEDEQLDISANLDNLKIAMQGTLDQSDNALDLAGTLSIGKAKANDYISVGRALTDLPLPFYCKGNAAKPDCGPDTQAAMSVAGDLIKSEGKRKAREKIQESLLDELEDKLPEGLREGAKQLLNLFNR